MSFEADNWRDARGKASEKLFQTLGKQQLKAERGVTVSQDMKSSPYSAGASEHGAASRKRRRDGGDVIELDGAVQVKTQEDTPEAHKRQKTRPSPGSAPSLGSTVVHDAAPSRSSEASRLMASRPDPAHMIYHCDIPPLSSQAPKPVKRARVSAIIDLTFSEDDEPLPCAPVRASSNGFVKLPERLPYTARVAHSTPAVYSAPAIHPAPAVHSAPAPHSTLPTAENQLASSPPPNLNRVGVWAVRVGWMPGIYMSEVEAALQTLHYPHSEKQLLTSIQHAEQWLSGPSAKRNADVGRPQHTDRINRTEFTRFLQRTWEPSNERKINSGLVVNKLRFLFAQACTDAFHEVDWYMHALPQDLVYHEEHGCWPDPTDGQVELVPRHLRTSLGLQLSALRPRHVPAPQPSQPTWALNAHIRGSPPSKLPPTHPGAAVDPGSSFPVLLSSSPPTSGTLSQGPQVHAVRVGWFPGIYDTKTEANYQIKNYPHKERQTFADRAAAETWLAQPSIKKNLDAPTRPRSTAGINKKAFMQHVAQAWSSVNEMKDIKTKDIMKKLIFVFKQAGDDSRNAVNWAMQPMPQVLISRERETAKQYKVDVVPLGLWSGALELRNTTPRQPAVRHPQNQHPQNQHPQTQHLQGQHLPGKHLQAGYLQSQHLQGQYPQSRQLQSQHVQSQHVQSQHVQSQYFQSQNLQSQHLQTQMLPTSFVQAATTPLVQQRVTKPAAQKVCSCGKSVTDLGQSVDCASVECENGTFHKSCVGLASRKDTTGWRCRLCRPKPAPGTLPPSQRPTQSQYPSSTQAPPSSQIRTSPPPMTIVPTTAMTVREGPAIAEPPLHPEQETVVSSIESGDNVFYTGSAGTGKSTVLKAFVKRLQTAGKKIDIIAPSGIAALNVGGSTIYSYAGWRPDSLKEPLEKLEAGGFGKAARKRLCGSDVLVIDEISMVERDLLIRLDKVMRHVRHGWRPTDEKGRKVKPNSPHDRELPFGGAQLVVTGDFCQLPPVKPFRTCVTCGGDEMPGYQQQNGKPLTCTRCGKIHEDKDKWAFRSETWTTSGFQYFELKHIHRQSDKRFIDILQRCRYGQALSPAQERLLLAEKPDPVGAVKLLPRKSEVEFENRKNFDNLKTPARRLECEDHFHWRNQNTTPELQKHKTPRYPDDPDGALMALKDHRLAEGIQLKEGMLVILLTNLDFKLGLVNGSQGKIIGWEQHDNSKVFPPREPSKPSRSGPSAKYDSSPSKPKGSSSRQGRDADVLTMGVVPDYIQTRDEQVRKFINRNNVTSWPVVQFTNGVVQAIYAHCEMSELGAEEPYSSLGRTQIPLLAAWAITIHKSQGMTLDRVIVDLYHSFEREMVYVALSRARNLEGLKVIRLARQMQGGVNEEVQAFLREHGLGCAAN